MEAFRFGFAPDTPPAFKFDPTDDDIVAHYLLPRALGIPNPPFAHAVLDTNPASFPPPELLARHGHANSHHAFFLDVTTSNGGRRERVINGRDGGTWRGQQGQYHILTLLSPAGHEVNIKYKRYDLTVRLCTYVASVVVFVHLVTCICTQRVRLYILRAEPQLGVSSSSQTHCFTQRVLSQVVLCGFVSE
jgi:hypothetical protein